MKRIFDLIVASLCLAAFLPLMILVAIIIKIKLGSPIFFRQARPGLNGRVFTIIKFRTMTDALDAGEAVRPDAQRLNAFGSFLRRASLDELPELINVLKGDMSLVGPRPLLMQYLDRYSPEQARRHEVKPGITGWAQVNGRNSLTWEEKFKLDVWYVDHQGFFLDLKIILMTIWKAIMREGISHAGQATMPEFRGQPNGDGHDE